MKKAYQIIFFCLITVVANAQEEVKHSMLRDFNEGISITKAELGCGLSYRSLGAINEIFDLYNAQRPWLSTQASLLPVFPEFVFGNSESFPNNTRIEILLFYRYFRTESGGISTFTDKSSTRKFNFSHLGLKLIFLKTIESIGPGFSAGAGIELRNNRLNTFYDHNFNAGSNFIYAQWVPDITPKISWKPKPLKDYADFYFSANLPLQRTDITSFKETFGIEEGSNKIWDWGVNIGLIILL